MPTPHVRGYSPELNILLYKERRNDDIKSYDDFNISLVMLSSPGDLLLFREKITLRNSLSVKLEV